MNESPSGTNGPVVVGLGEVLFDCLPDRMVLGGAPVNLAVHAHQLLATCGGRGTVVSRVGDDENGRKLIEELGNRGIDTRLIQRDPRLPTGTVQVELNRMGEPSYEIVENVAWEHLEFDESLDLLARNCNAVCFGTLAQRREPSRATIHRFLSTASSAIRLLDVNLRQSFYSPEVLEESFAAATVVKLNQDELTEVSSLLNAKASALDATDVMVRNLQETYHLDYVVLTRGSQGTLLYDERERYDAEPITVDRAANADSVGAGDACAAAIVCGLLLDWPAQRILEWANRMGAFVASRPGATPQLPKELVEFGSVSPEQS